ncbi:hypothetical protein [Vallitalea maricola]|uniref:Uncharacterized protein n=1 Tax=Vallitalea maricola TaxID=3074433 RepID=A0ACB5UJ23_9FIRM|nr:hypothetical protein AN2V17_16980 [Vallitalea sp. AN17-2]
MKKLSILVVTMLIAVLLCSCISKTDTSGSDLQEPNSDVNTPEYIKDIENMSDEDFLYNYINGLEVACNLNFGDASEISSDDLFTFFLYSLFIDEISYEEYNNKWFDNELNMFVIPEEDITSQLDRYFKGYDFDITKVEKLAAKYYDESKNAILISIIDGFGGERFTKIIDRSMDGNVVSITVEFYDEDYKELFETKTYEIEFHDNEYYLLKIETIE